METSALVCSHCAVVVAAIFFIHNYSRLYQINLRLFFFSITSGSPLLRGSQLRNQLVGQAVSKKTKQNKTMKGTENIIRNNCNNSTQFGRFDRQNVE